MCFDAAPIQGERMTRSGCCDGVDDSSAFASDPKGWYNHVDGASWLKFGKGDLTAGDMDVLSLMMAVIVVPEGSEKVAVY